jgi:hypothetical protein
MAKIIINRKREWTNRLRKFQVFIDGIPSGEIRNGGAEEFGVTPGKHTVQCKMGRYSSNFLDVTLGSDAVQFVVVKSNMKFFWLFYILMIGAIAMPFIFRLLKTHEPENFQWYRSAILGIAICYFLYFVLFKRNSYLTVAPDDNNIFNN